MKKQWFETWFDTTYYHILYNHRNEEEAARFVENLMDYFHLPEGSEIMDLACGKGRHAAKMAEMGFQVTGTDLAANSIRNANDEYRALNVAFQVHNMLNTWKGESFDLVTNLFTSFGYFNTTDQNIKVLKNIKDMLKPGGQFVIDFLNAVKVQKGLVPIEQQVKENIEFDIKREVKNGKILKSISFKADGKDHQYQEEVQALTLDDFKEMIEKAGLILTDVKGDYELNDFDEKSSPRLILIGKRK